MKPIYDGFLALSHARQIGFSSAQPISISEVLSYCTLMGIEGEESREEFLYFVQFLDRIFLSEMERRKPASPSKGAKK